MACEDVITIADLEKAKLNAGTSDEFVNSNDDFTPNQANPGEPDIRTLEGINNAADAAIGEIGGIDIGDYSSNLTLNNYNEYVVFDRAGLTTGPSLWKAKSPKGATPGTPLPYTIDSATYPDPTSDSNIEPFSDVNKAYVDNEVGNLKADADLHDTLAGAKSRTDLVDNPSNPMRIYIYEKKGFFTVVSGETPDEYSILAAANGLQLKLEVINVVFAENFGVVANVLADQTPSAQAAVDYARANGIGEIALPNGAISLQNLNLDDISVWLHGVHRETTRLVNRGAGNVIKAVRTPSNFTFKLKLSDFALGLDTSVETHTASGDHAMHIDGYNDLQIENILISQAGASGIYTEDIFVQAMENIFGGHCGQNASLIPSDQAVIRYERTSTGNSIRITDSYISNSTITDGIRVNGAQSVSISNTTLESCLDLVSIGTIGVTSRNVTLDTVYFENPVVSSGNFTSVYGLDIRNCYNNLVGTRSDVVYRNFRFEECDRVSVTRGSLSDPGDPLNPNYKGALEFVTGSNLAYKGQVTIDGSTSMQTVCIDATTAGRSTQNLLVNRCGLDVAELRGLEKPNANLLTNTDITTWSNAGALPIATGEFYDGETMYIITGDNSNTINVSVAGTFNQGSDLSFSAFIAGACRLQMRGRRVSDNGFETIATNDKLGSDTGSNVGGDLVRRFYVNSGALSDYNLINVIIRPAAYDVDIAYVQLNTSLTPTNYK